MSFAAGRRVRLFRWPVCVNPWMTRAAIFRLLFARSQMQLTFLELEQDAPPQLSSGKTSPASLTPRTMPSAAFLQALPGKMVRSSRQGENGRTLVLFMDPKEQSRGGFLTPNISVWPNDGVVCSLSQALETGLIPRQFFLSSTACEGILRRAEKRGKRLPTQLLHALQAVAAESQELETPEDKILSLP